MLDLNAQPLICLVDDDHVNIKLMTYMLGREYQICVANTGEQALLTIEAQQPDLILLDIMMDDIDGLDVCDQLKSNPETAHIPIVFVSGLENDTDQAKGFEAGASDYITKPVTAGLLKARVQRVLEKDSQLNFLKSLLTVNQSADELQERIRCFLEDVA